MPVPGVPILDPVEKPRANPREFGKPGMAIAGIAEDSAQLAEAGTALQGHIREAQQHVDILAATNQLAASDEAYQVQLSKTQNSRDIEGLIHNQQDTLNSIAQEWGKSPAAIQIQLHADSLRPRVDHLGQVRQIDLMGKEFKLSVAKTGESLAKDYAGARAVGDEAGEQNSVAAFTQAVAGGQKTGLVGDAEAADMVRSFKEQGQELQIRNAISNPDPGVNQKIYDQMNANPQQFPDVKPEQLDILKGHALAAVENHYKLQEWAEGKAVERTMLPETINSFTNPATGQLDEGKALAYTAEKFRTGVLTLKQNETMAAGIRAYSAQQKQGIVDQTIKADDQIEQHIKNNDFKGAYQVADGLRQTTESADIPWYSNAGKRIDAARRQSEAEYRANWGFEQRQQKVDRDEESQANSSQLLSGVTSGRLNEQNLADLLGSQKINYKNYLQLSNLAKRIQNKPDTKKALSVLYGSIPPLPKTASPADQLEQDNLKWNLYEDFQKGVGEKNLKGDDKSKYAAELVKPFVTKDIGDRLDKMFGSPAQPKAEPDSGSWLTRAKGESWTTWLEHRTGDANTPKENDTKKNSAGDNVIFKGGKWQPAP